MTTTAASMLKKIVPVSTSRKWMVCGIFLRFSATGTINDGQTSFMKIVICKGKSASRKEEIKHYENYAKK